MPSSANQTSPLQSCPATALAVLQPKLSVSASPLQTVASVVRPAAGASRLVKSYCYQPNQVAVKSGDRAVD